MNNNAIKMLFVLCLVMLGVLAIEWSLFTFSKNTMAVVDNKQKDAEIDLPKLEIEKQAVDNYSDMIERPLFVEGRKPLIYTEEGSNAISVSNIDDLVLIGIYSAKEQLFALFSQQGKDKKFLKIKQGDELSGWLLIEIRSDQVVLEKHGKQQTLMLRKPKPKKTKKLRPLARKQIKLKS